MIGAPSLLHAAHAQSHAALRGEFEGVGKEVQHHLLQPLLVGADRGRQPGIEIDLEIEPLVGRELAERPLHMLSESAHRHLADLRSDEQTSELQSLMRISYAVFCLKK